MVQVYKVGDRAASSLGAYADEIREFAAVYYDRLQTPDDYGTGTPVKYVEASTLALIEHFPGITVSELADRQRRTKGTVSSTVTALEKAGYVLREKREGNAKVVHLYATAEGEKLSTLYTSRISKDAADVQRELLKTCSTGEIDAFCKVLHQYLHLLEGEKKK